MHSSAAYGPFDTLTFEVYITTVLKRPLLFQRSDPHVKFLFSDTELCYMQDAWFQSQDQLAHRPSTNRFTTVHRPTHRLRHIDNGTPTTAQASMELCMITFDTTTHHDPRGGLSRSRSLLRDRPSLSRLSDRSPRGGIGTRGFPMDSGVTGGIRTGRLDRRLGHPPSVDVG